MPQRKASKAKPKPKAKPKSSSAKRELVNTGRSKQLVRRDSKGKFKESVELGRSLTADRRRKAKATAPKGQGDRGDRRASR